MSIANYDDLKTAIANWLNDSNIAAYIPDFISLAEARIYRELRINSMMTSLSSAISSGVIAVPSDFLEFSYVAIDGSPASKLDVKTPEWIMNNYPNRSSDAKPRFIAKEGSNFIFGPYPDSNYTVIGSYYKRMPALISASTNWFTSNAPDILLFASLVEAEPFIMNDERISIWESKYQIAKHEIQKEDKRGRIMGSPQRSEAR